MERAETPDVAMSEIFEAIVRQTPEAIVFADRAGVIRVWNQGAASVFGFSEAEAVGQSRDLIVPERFRRAHWEGYQRAIAEGHPRLGAHIRTTRSLHKDGRKLYVEMSFGIVTRADGASVGSVAVARTSTSSQHITERGAPTAQP